MVGNEAGLPREERIEFDTPILAEPRPGSAVIGELYEGDTVTVTGFHDGFAQIAIGTRRAAYVRQDAVGIPLPRPVRPDAVPSAARSGSIVAEQKSDLGRISPAHGGALLVATGLTILAWITLVLSQLTALWVAAEYSCGDSPGWLVRLVLGSSCGNEGLQKLLAGLSFAVPGLFMALLMWATAYGLLLLTSVEANTRVLVFHEE